MSRSRSQLLGSIKPPKCSERLSQRNRNSPQSCVRERKMASRVSSWALLVVALSVVAGIGAAKSKLKKHVITLDSSNFHETVSKHDFIVVDFYAPWCGHCKHLTPEYEKAASMLSSHDPPVVLAKFDVNEEKNKELASKYEIKGLPTLKIFRNGGKDVQVYKGPREAEGIVSYLKRQTGPASTEIKSVEDASSFIDDGKIAVVGVFPKFSGEEFESFVALAEKLRSDYNFRHTLDAKLLPRGDSSVSGPVVRLFKPFDELFVDTKDFHVDAMEKFVEESSIPIVTIYDKDPNNNPFIVKFFSNDKSKAMLFMNLSSEVSDAFKPTYGDVAKQYKGEGLSFLLGDLEAGQGAILFYGLKEEQAPLFLIQTSDGQKYLKPQVKPDEIAPWVKEFKAGNVPRFMKSEPIPAENNEPTKVIVADTLQDLVLNSGKNVLLEFHAPWCGHCKKLAPILDEVATSYKSDSAVLIAKLDAFANDIPKDTFDVKGYPAVYFRTASGKLMRYEGDRTKEDIVDFIEKNRDKTVEIESGKDEL